MERVEQMIQEVRRQTGNERYDANSGVSQAQMVRMLKNAQDELYKHIVNAKTMMFSKETLVPIVANAELYEYPDDIYLQNINTLQWRYITGPNASQGLDYINLFPGYVKDRVQSESGYPFSYVIRGDGFLLVPPVQTGTLRCTYIKKLPSPQIRAGQISAVTTASGLITAMTVNIASPSFDPVSLNELQALSIVNKYGEAKALGIEIDSINAGSGVVTFSTPQPLTLGGDAVGSVAVGDYVTAGFWTYNRPAMPDICESHLLKHAIYETRYGDMSNWTKAALDDLTMSLQTILSSFQNPTDDTVEIPLTNTDYLDLSL